MRKTSKTTKTSGNSIVFFGTGPVAAKSLELLSTTFTIEAVVTKPQPPHHKDSFPVITTSDNLGLPIKTVINKQDLSQLIATRPFKSRIAVLVDFGIIVSQDVIDYFPLGIVNSHFSLLPQWRGADPITFAILSGQKQTGVSLMLLVEKMDEGPLLAQSTYDIPANMTTPQLTDELVELSDRCLKEILPLYIEGSIQAIPQESATITSDKTPTYSRKLAKADGIIDWNMPAKQIEREIRAFIDWPKSRTEIFGKEVIVCQARLQNDILGDNPGEAVVINNELYIYTTAGSLHIEKLKPAGKKEMTGRAFIAGYARLL